MASPPCTLAEQSFFSSTVRPAYCLFLFLLFQPWISLIPADHRLLLLFSPLASEKMIEVETLAEHVRRKEETSTIDNSYVNQNG
jgi:hypothetical protein